MKKWLIALVAACVLAVATGYSAYEKHVQTRDQFCILYTTLVTQIDKGLETVTYKEAKQYADAYNRGYKYDIQLENALISEAPCTIQHTPPPNVLTEAKNIGLPTTNPVRTTQATR